MNELKIKKNWLNSLIIFYTFDYITFLPAIASDPIISKFSHYIICSFVLAIVEFCKIMLIYYFAYKKKGTKLLGLILLSIPIPLLQGIIKNKKNSINFTNDVIVWCIFVVIVDLYFWYNCYRLFKLNQQYWSQKQNNSKSINSNQIYQP